LDRVVSSIPVVPAVVFQAATATLDDLGFSSEKVVERAGLPQYQFLEPQAKIPGVHLYRLYGRAARVIGEGGYGSFVPGHMPITEMSALGQAVQSAPTVYRAIDHLFRLYNSASSIARFWTVQNEEGILCLRRSLMPAGDGSRQMELASLSYMVQAVRLGAGSGWRPTRVFVERDPIPQMDRLESFAGLQILRNQGISGFAIPHFIAQRPMPSSASPEPIGARRFVGNGTPEELVASLRQVLRSLVRLGHPRLETVAELAGVHVRTLQRQLKEEGLSFRKVVDEARFLEARDLLGVEDVPLIDIAHELSYSDQAHFNHAFRRWAGVSPSQYRSDLQPG